MFVRFTTRSCCFRSIYHVNFVPAIVASVNLWYVYRTCGILAEVVIIVKSVHLTVMNVHLLCTSNCKSSLYLKKNASDKL